MFIMKHVAPFMNNESHGAKIKGAVKLTDRKLAVSGILSLSKGFQARLIELGIIAALKTTLS